MLIRLEFPNFLLNNTQSFSMPSDNVILKSLFMILLPKKVDFKNIKYLNFEKKNDNFENTLIFKQQLLIFNLANFENKSRFINFKISRVLLIKFFFCKILFFYTFLCIKTNNDFLVLTSVT